MQKKEKQTEKPKDKTEEEKEAKKKIDELFRQMRCNAIYAGKRDII